MNKNEAADGLGTRLVRESIRFKAGGIGFTTGRANTEAKNQMFSHAAKPKECNNFMAQCHPVLASSINRYRMSLQLKW